jgi:5-methylthioadenosine/S-adenosylhomocysteine deaminase
MARDEILVRGVLIVAGPAREMPFFGWVRLRNHRIDAVGRGEAPACDGRVIDGRNRILIPGLVNTHAHSHSSLTRGSAEGMSLEPWLAAVIREQSRLTAAQAEVGALATYAEALLSGTTAIMDMCIIPEVALEAAEKIGIRAFIAPYVSDSMGFTPTIDRSAKLLREARGRHRTQVWVGLHGLETCSDGQIRDGIALAREEGTGVHLHCSESRASTAKTVSRTGRTPVAQLEHLGAFEVPTHLAHCVWVNESDQRTMAVHGASAAHCPHANLKVGSGIAPVTAMRKAGVRVALGTDGAKANNRLDMFDVMKFASLLPKGTFLDPAALPPADVLRMATAEGAAALRLNAGEIIPGQLADLTLITADNFHLQPALPETVITNVVHAARGGDIDTVIVDGRVVVERGRLALVDQDELLARRAATGRALLAGMDSA